MKKFLKFVLFFVATHSGIAQTDDSLEKGLKDILKEGNYTFQEIKVSNEVSGEERNIQIPVDPATSKIELSPYQFEREGSEQIKLTLDTVGRKKLEISFRGSSLFIRSNFDGDIPEMRINFTSNDLQLDDKSLKFHEKISVLSPGNIFNSSWNGFQWRYKDEKQHYNVTIGKINESGQVYIKLDGVDSFGRKRKILLLS